MPVTTDQPAPYAPASAILELIDRHRNKGLPAVVDADVLMRAGISGSLVPRTLQALKTLDLLTEDGRPSQVLEGLRLAPTSEYQKRLGEWLQATYADALSYVDPTTDDEVAIRDAFRTYIPTGQQSRMVTLFIGLFTAAGVMAPRQKAAPPKRGPNGGSLARPSKPRGAARAQEAGHISSKQQRAVLQNGDLPAAIAGLLATLPSEGGFWTQQRRDQFMATLGAVLDYTFKIGEPPAEEPEAAYDL